MIVAHCIFPNDGRKLKNLIQALLRSKIVSRVERVNYAKSYFMLDWLLKKEESKLLIIRLPEANKDKLIAFLKKQYPEIISDLIFYPIS